jgi:hypothetical protein
MKHSHGIGMLMTGMCSAFFARQVGQSVEVFHSTSARWLDGAHGAHGEPEDGDVEAGKITFLPRTSPTNGPRLKKINGINCLYGRGERIRTFDPLVPKQQLKLYVTRV